MLLLCLISGVEVRRVAAELDVTGLLMGIPGPSITYGFFLGWVCVCVSCAVALALLAGIATVTLFRLGRRGSKGRLAALYART
jgi:hypothetical protein